ncbi:MAG: biotin/lipoyl-binding protein, partial [Candidatus Baltobacteraceae bacterium]
MIGRITVPLGGKSFAGSLPNLSGLTKWLEQHRVILSVAALLLVAVLAGVTITARSHGAVAYTTEPVVRQDLLQTITASGTVNPQNTVTVGTQASGAISAIYVDYNSKVKKGEVLARIDPSQIQAQLDQAQAGLAQAQAQAGAQAADANGAQSGVTVAQAGIQTAQANVAKAQSSLTFAEQTVARDKALLAQGYVAQSQYDSDQSNAVTARSALEGAQAAAIQATAQTAQTSAQAVGSQYTAAAQNAAAQAAQAQVAQDRYNLQHSVITSPVDGT